MITIQKREQQARESSDEALAILDGDGRPVGTVRLHACIDMFSSHAKSAP